MQKNKKDVEKFISYKNRETHWGEPSHRPLIPNVATVLPPDLPEPMLKALLIRMQIEEANYKLEHIDEELDYIIWKENSLDSGIWASRQREAKISRAKEVLSYEIRAATKAFDEMFPAIIPPPKAPTS